MKTGDLIFYRNNIFTQITNTHEIATLGIKYRCKNGGVFGNPIFLRELRCIKKGKTSEKNNFLYL